MVERRIREDIRCYGKWFLTKEARQALAAGKTLPKDPYAKNWYSEREADIFRDVGGATLLEGAYGSFSEWHHWRIRAFGRLLSFDESISTLTIATSDPSQVAMAVATGFQCLWQTMRLFNARCRLGMGQDLRRLRKQQIALGK